MQRAQEKVAQIDRYPSRACSMSRVLPRVDPVVYGTANDGPLSATQLERYAEDGYLHFDRLFDQTELEHWLVELECLWSDATHLAAPYAIVEPDSHQLRSLFAVHQISDVMRSLAAHPALVQIAQQLLASDVYVHQSRINYKGGFRGKEFYWHSDFETWHVEDGLPAMRAVSCSISLTPNTYHNGPLMLIPGSHTRFISCSGVTAQGNYKKSLRKQELGVPDDAVLDALVREYGITALTGDAASVTFFECNTLHGSNSNITPLPRSNIFIVYNSLDNKPVMPFCGLAPRPDFLAERTDFTPASSL